MMKQRSVIKLTLFDQNEALCITLLVCFVSGEEDEVEVSVFSFNESLTIVSPNFPNNYPNNARVQWLVSGPEDSQIVAVFNSFDLESGFDFLTVGSGLDATDQTSLFVTLSGSYLPGDVVSINNEMWLNFTSDSSVTREGFWIEIMVFDPHNNTGNISSKKKKKKMKHICYGILSQFLAFHLVFQ